MVSAVLGFAGIHAVATLMLLVASQPCEVFPGGPQLWGYDVVTELPHDARAFTQGLQHDVVCDAQNSCSEVFWESTGTVDSCKLLQTMPLLTSYSAAAPVQMRCTLCYTDFSLQQQHTQSQTGAMAVVTATRNLLVLLVLLGQSPCPWYVNQTFMSNL